MATTAGSFALLNSIPSSDAPVIAKLRAAGAIILGKSTMTELGNLKSSVEKMGRSARGGQGQSAYVAGGYAAGGDPLGSSSGSAIAVSAGWAAASLGAETLGSLVAPAGRAALYCLRPTLGLVSRDGTIPGAKSFDMVGPMGKSAYDVALVLQHIAGTDPKDPASKCR
jgi:amidase